MFMNYLISQVSVVVATNSNESSDVQLQKPKWDVIAEGVEDVKNMDESHYIPMLPPRLNSDEQLKSSTDRNELSQSHDQNSHVFSYNRPQFSSFTNRYYENSPKTNSNPSINTHVNGQTFYRANSHPANYCGHEKMVCYPVGSERCLMNGNSYLNTQSTMRNGYDTSSSMNGHDSLSLRSSTGFQDISPTSSGSFVSKQSFDDMEKDYKIELLTQKLKIAELRIEKVEKIFDELPKMLENMKNEITKEIFEHVSCGKEVFDTLAKKKDDSTKETSLLRRFKK